MPFDVQEQRIYALPYADYRAGLSQRSQASLQEQYAYANAHGEMVVFVRDNDAEKLVSYSVPLPELETPRKPRRRRPAARKARNLLPKKK